jgi:hypothetical protein
MASDTSQPEKASSTPGCCLRRHSQFVLVFLENALPAALLSSCTAIPGCDSCSCAIGYLTFLEVAPHGRSMHHRLQFPCRQEDVLMQTLRRAVRAQWPAYSSCQNCIQQLWITDCAHGIYVFLSFPPACVPSPSTAGSIITLALALTHTCPVCWPEQLRKPRRDLDLQHRPISRAAQWMACHRPRIRGAAAGVHYAPHDIGQRDETECPAVNDLRHRSTRCSHLKACPLKQ